MEWCFEAVRRGRSVAVVGVYGSPYDNYPIHRIFDKGLNISFGQSYVHKDFDHTFELLKQGKVVLDDIITHRLPLSEAPHAYDIFKKKKDNCVKVVLNP
jgi:alcohol dehydrogenase